MPASSSSLIHLIFSLVSDTVSTNTTSTPAMALDDDYPELLSSSPSTESKLSPKIPQLRGQITKQNFCKALGLQEEDLKDMIAWGTKVCEERGAFKARLTLRELQKNDSNFISLLLEHVCFCCKQANYIHSSKSLEHLNA